MTFPSGKMALLGGVQFDLGGNIQRIEKGADFWVYRCKNPFISSSIVVPSNVKSTLMPTIERFFTAMDNETIAVVTSTTTLLELL